MRAVGRLAGWYGANPLHLLALLGSFALAGYAAARFVSGNPVGVGIWFAGAVVGHDLVLLPLYSLADRSVAAVLGRRSAPLPPGPWLNHVRVPTVLAALLLAVFFPLILGLPGGFSSITGRSVTPYLGRWLLVTGLLFCGSAVILALRLRVVRRSPDRVRPGSPVGADEVLDQQRGDRLDREPPPVTADREERAGREEPDRER